MTRWEYMILCPDTDPGHCALFDAGHEGWEAVCCWQDRSGDNIKRRNDGANHVLLKRPVEKDD